MTPQEKLAALKKQWESKEISRIFFQYDCTHLLFDIPEPTYEDLDSFYDATSIDDRIKEMWVEWLNTMCFADPVDLVTIFGGVASSNYREPPRMLNEKQKAAIIDWLAKRGLVDKVTYCKHENLPVTFDETEAQGLDVFEIRKRWPRYWGPCPSCGGQVIGYASYLHYICGDW